MPCVATFTHRQLKLRPSVEGLLGVAPAGEEA
jgi:hypothetical protein